MTQEDQITSGNGTLWGGAGGQLEFVSMKFITRKEHTGLKDIWRKYVVMTFTDHDLRAVPEEELYRLGLKPHYELEFPIE